jgi:protein SCO1/2
MKKQLSYLITILYLICFTSFISANEEQIEVGIDEKLGATLPHDAQFVTSEGDTVLLGDLINTPVLLALVYYECPGICSPMLTELAWVANKVDLKPGSDFKVISLSFDHEETPEIAAKWKKNYLESVDNQFPADDWIFLTGDSVNIHKVTDAAGFYFKPSRDEFVHAGSIVTVSPESKISRYLFGTKYNPFDVKMALLDADAGKTQPTIAKVLQFCFSYDPEGRSYTLNITRIVGSVMLLGVGIFVIFLIRKKKS